MKSSVNEVKVEEKIIENLLEAYEDIELYEDSDNVTMPIKYPVAKLRIKKEMKQENTISEDVKNFIKVEPGDSPPRGISLEGKFFSRIKSDSFPEMNNWMTDIKKTEGGKSLMLLLQFPSCLPSEILPDIDSKNKKKVDNKNEPIAGSCKKSNLREIPEGHLGKLQVLRSGKMRLVIGSIQISVEEGIVPESLSEVISISAEGNDDDIIVLGKIERKMILKPHFTVIKNNSIFNNGAVK